jgi:hypothetical protein
MVSAKTWSPEVLKPARWTFLMTRNPYRDSSRMSSRRRRWRGKAEGGQNPCSLLPAALRAQRVPRAVAGVDCAASVFVSAIFATALQTREPVVAVPEGVQPMDPPRQMIIPSQDQAFQGPRSALRAQLRLKSPVFLIDVERMIPVAVVHLRWIDLSFAFVAFNSYFEHYSFSSSTVSSPQNGQ